ncbi:MAG: flagellar biosynthesis protein FlhB [Acidobacteria bacterium]|nr:flagellar biosynthesis protein FlhB [Acidobacteriota bacterium]
MAGDRTEKPTPKKLQDARKKGQVARSKDLAVAAATIAATIALAQSGGRLVNGLAADLASALAHVGDAPMRTVTGGDLQGIVVTSLATMISLVAPVALATMVVGVGVHGLQGGWNFSVEPLQFRWNRLNPAENVKRFALINSGVDTLKTLVAAAVIAYVSWRLIEDLFESGVRMAWLSPFGAASLGWDYGQSLLWRVGLALGALALADYGLQIYRLRSSLRMTKQEIRDEGKQNEGNAEVKGKIRRIQREFSRRRMIQDVARATVVITNPTHYAIALEYRRGEMAAPIVLAKGQDHLAARIREAAREHGVPLVENKPLAQTLYRSAEIGEAIPADLFGAVAEVLAQLVRLRQITL